jgi:ribosomal protein S18 acetylase RimI-like enzyme
MPAVNDVTIKPLPLRQVMALRRLFVNAVRTHFTYFDSSVQDRVIHNHRPIKLAQAVIHPRRLVLSAWRNGELVGYAIGSVPRHGGAQLYWLYVEPGDRGNNTGLALLSRMIKRARHQGADSLTLATYDHRRYYERQGFRYVGTQTVDGLPMAIMRYSL